MFTLRWARGRRLCARAITRFMPGSVVRRTLLGFCDFGVFQLSNMWSFGIYSNWKGFLYFYFHYRNYLYFHTVNLIWLFFLCISCTKKEIYSLRQKEHILSHKGTDDGSSKVLLSVIVVLVRNVYVLFGQKLSFPVRQHMRIERKRGEICMKRISYAGLNHCYSRAGFISILLKGQRYQYFTSIFDIARISYIFHVLIVFSSFFFHWGQWPADAHLAHGTPSSRPPLPSLFPFLIPQA